MKTVITLPENLAGRHAVRRLTINGNAADAIVDATATSTHDTAGTHELVKRLLAQDAHRVIVVNATPSLRRALEAAHRARTRPERTFLLLFQTVSADALLRPV